MSTTFTELSSISINCNLCRHRKYLCIVCVHIRTSVHISTVLVAMKNLGQETRDLRTIYVWTCKHAHALYFLRYEIERWRWWKIKINRIEAENFTFYFSINRVCVRVSVWNHEEWNEEKRSSNNRAKPNNPIQLHWSVYTWEFFLSPDFSLLSIFDSFY